MLLKLSIVICVATLATAQTFDIMEMFNLTKLDSGPQSLEDFSIIDMERYRIKLTNVKFRGYDDFLIKVLTPNKKTKIITIKVVFSELILTANLDYMAEIFGQAEGKGPIVITAREVPAKMEVKYDLISKNGAYHMVGTAVTTKLTIDKFTFDVTEVKRERGSDKIVDIFNFWVTGYRETVNEIIVPILEKNISRKLKQITKNVRDL